MVSIPRYDDIKHIFSSEEIATEYLVKKFNQYNFNSHFSNQEDHDNHLSEFDHPENHHPDIHEIDDDHNHNHDDNNPSNHNQDFESHLENLENYNDQNISNISTESNGFHNNSGMNKSIEKKKLEEMSELTNKLETSTNNLMYHTINVTDATTFKQNLLLRSELPCHLLLYMSHLWLAHCSKEAIAILVGCDIEIVIDWISYCIQHIRDKIEKEVKFLPLEERIIIAERMWRRRYKDKLWDGLLEIVFKPILDAERMKKKNTVILTEPEDIVVSFEAMGLREDLLDGIIAAGISEPTDVRQRAVKPIIIGQHVIVQAPTSTDKTMALCIAVLQLLDTNKLHCQAIVAVSTRQQADQIMKTLLVIGKFMHVKVHSCMNGNSLRDDIRLLSHGIHVIIGTISRIQDMIHRKTLRTDQVKLIMFDDADSICFHNSRERQEKLFESFKMPSTQLCLFTEVITPEVEEIIKDYMKNPIHVEIKKEQLSLRNIKQFCVNFNEPNEKIHMLIGLWSTLKMTQTVVYCSCSQKVEWLSNLLQSEGYETCYIHADMKRSDRIAVLDEYRVGGGLSPVLITTDIRGMHFERVPLVINFDLPLYREGYLKRCGRYYNHKAVVMNFVLPRDTGHMNDIKKFHEIQVTDLPMTEVAELAFEVFKII